MGEFPIVSKAWHVTCFPDQLDVSISPPALHQIIHGYLEHADVMMNKCN
jgi:hypothetical protein